MKRFILLSIITLFVANLHSQDESTQLIFPSLVGVKEFNYSFDYSLMKIDNIDGKDYILIHSDSEAENPDKIFQNYTKKIETAFISSANSRSLQKKGYILSNKDSLRFEVLFFITTVDDDGGHKVVGIIRDKENKTEITQLEASAGGGKLNSTKVLFLEELEKSGEKFGDRLANILYFAGKEAKKSSYNYRKLKGYRGMIDWSWIYVSEINSEPCLEITTAHGMQFNSYFFLGAGVGVTYWTKQESVSVPLFANLRFDIPTGKKANPFFDVKIGYSPLGDISGLYSKIAVGCRFALGRKRKYGLFIGLGYHLQRGNITKDTYDEQTYKHVLETKTTSLNGFVLNIGFDF